MKKVYVDNASTSFPKADGVSSAMKGFLDNNGCNIGRGGYANSYSAAMEVHETRQALATFFGATSPQELVFTPSLTHAINMILLGFLGPSDHVITTSMEHNAVMRPLHALSKHGVSFDVARCDNTGMLDPETIASLINTKTKAVIMMHASNVCGTILPVEQVSVICRQHGLKLIVDAAQTAGVLSIDTRHIDALAFAGHKGMLGPQGIGGAVLKKEFAAQIAPIFTGGTGSFSHDFDQPECLPDKFEPGTLNISGIIGLKAAINHINSVGLDNIYKHEMRLAEQFILSARAIDGVSIIGRQDAENRVAVVSLSFADNDNALIAGELDSSYGIMTRCGLHCSPNAHKTLGTYPQGTIRFSFGHANTQEDVEYIVGALKEIVSKGFHAA